MKQTKEKGSDKKIHVKQKQDNSKFLASAATPSVPQAIFVKNIKFFDQAFILE